MQDNPSSPPDTRPPPRRIRFSLRQLAAAVLLVAMATVIVMQYIEIATLRPELRKARDQAGHLTIEDETKVYAIAVRELKKDTWSWRVYVPPGRSFWLYSQVNEVPATGFPDVPAPPSSGGAAHPNNVHVSELPPGEWLLTFGFVETAHKESTHELVSDKVGAAFRSTSRQPIKADSQQWPIRASTSSSSIGVGHACLESAPAEPFVLLRHRVANVSGSLSLTSGTSDGLMIWIAPGDEL